MDRYGIAYIFLYRYPKGMRTIGALPVGLSGMSWQRFTLLNAASAGLWVTVLVGLGYGFGAGITYMIDNNWGWVSVTLLIPFLGLAWIAMRRVSKALSDQEAASTNDDAPSPGIQTGRLRSPT